MYMYMHVKCISIGWGILGTKLDGNWRMSTCEQCACNYRNPSVNVPISV